MGILTYLNPNAINDNSISSSKIDGTVASKNYVDTQVKTVDDKVTALEPRVTNAVQITYAELKALRDTGKLVPGQQYRITDYTCTTTQANTKSAGHQFDIIVTADDETTLNEVARAIKHDGDTYFTNCDLNAWKLWYCLDNDTERFIWADSTNGKGVIYRMIDEFNNDCPYDFKNIQFKHSNTYYYYTFASNNVVDNTDYSLSISNKCYSNTINEYINSGKRKLNNIIFIGSSCCHNSFGDDCYDNLFGRSCYNNTFGNNCHDNSVEYGCYYNSFGDFCYNNFLLPNSYRNFFGSGCGYNTLGSGCQDNYFDSGCYKNFIGDNSYYNFFMSQCSYNTLGNNCFSNSFGTNCTYIKFTSDSSGTTKYNEYRSNHFGDSCKFIVFTGAETASYNNQVQNYNFAQGLQGTSSEYLTIDGVRNRAYETKVAKNSNGELKVYCEADLIL